MTAHGRLATFRTQTETDIVSEKLKLDAINNTDISENSDYYIGGKMEIRPNADTSFKHILYSWDVSGGEKPLYLVRSQIKNRLIRLIKKKKIN